MSPELRDILVIARSYCHLIEQSRMEDAHWLARVAELLPQLHAAIARMNPGWSKDDGDWDVDGEDLDQRFNLYVQLKALLGENDAYWLEYDVAMDDQQMSGSLADDLTDIYCELKQGLRDLHQGSRRSARTVLSSWRRGYRMHWGQHLLDAERHLYSLEQSGRLGIP